MYHRHCLSSNQWGLSWSIHKICGNYPTNQSIQSLLFNLRTSLLSAEWRLRKGCWSFAQAGWHQTYGVEDGVTITLKASSNKSQKSVRELEITSLNGWLGFSGKSISVSQISPFIINPLSLIWKSPLRNGLVQDGPPSYKLVYKPL